MVCVALFLLWGVTAGYYTPHFPQRTRWLLAVLYVGLVSAHLLLGKRMFVSSHPFPLGRFLWVVAVFTTIRWLYTYYVLQHHLPPDTIFHYPNKVLWFIIPSSAVLVFLGYSVALYRHLRSTEGEKTSIPQPTDLNTKSAPVLQFRSEGKEVQLRLDALLYIEANGEYMIYQCTDRRYLRFQRLKEAEAELAPFGFVRIHRSYIVARNAIRAYSRTSVELTQGTRLPLSRTYRSALN